MCKKDCSKKNCQHFKIKSMYFCFIFFNSNHRRNFWFHPEQHGHKFDSRKHSDLRRFNDSRFLNVLDHNRYRKTASTTCRSLFQSSPCADYTLSEYTHQFVPYATTRHLHLDEIRRVDDHWYENLLKNKKNQQITNKLVFFTHACETLVCAPFTDSKNGLFSH